MDRRKHAGGTMESAAPDLSDPDQVTFLEKAREAHRRPGHLIRRCRQIAVAIFLDEMAPFNITSEQYGTLSMIRSYPGIDQRTLADLIAIDRSTIGTLLERLEGRGYIERRMPAHNQRIKQAFITPVGRQVLEDSAEALERVQQRILAPLEPAEQQMLVHLLHKMVRANNELSRAPVRCREDPAPRAPNNRQCTD